MPEEHLPWTDNEQEAQKIFRFFDSYGIGMAGGGPILVVGDIGEKTLVLTCPQNELRTMGLECYSPERPERGEYDTREIKKRREKYLMNNGDVVVRGCIGIAFDESAKSLRITGDSTFVIVTEDGIISGPRTSDE